MTPVAWRSSITGRHFAASAAIRTVFQGVQNGAATILEQGPVESTQFMYDGRSGMLTAVRSTRQQPTGQVQSQLTLTRQR